LRYAPTSHTAGYGSDVFVRNDFKNIPQYEFNPALPPHVNHLEQHLLSRQPIDAFPPP